MRVSGPAVQCGHRQQWPILWNWVCVHCPQEGACGWRDFCANIQSAAHLHNRGQCLCRQNWFHMFIQLSQILFDLNHICKSSKVSFSCVYNYFFCIVFNLNWTLYCKSVNHYSFVDDISSRVMWNNRLSFWIKCHARKIVTNVWSNIFKIVSSRWQIVRSYEKYRVQNKAAKLGFSILNHSMGELLGWNWVYLISTEKRLKG